MFASPSNHRVHHGINDRYLDKNYGGIFIAWDRLFGTFEPEVERPVFGVRGGLSTFDPIGANLSYYATMADLCRRATDRCDKLKVWFAPPGWVPANMRPNEPLGPFDLKAVKPYDPPAGRSVTVLAFAALVAMIVATAAFLAALQPCRSRADSPYSFRSQRPCGPWARCSTAASRPSKPYSSSPPP